MHDGVLIAESNSVSININVLIWNENYNKLMNMSE